MYILGNIIGKTNEAGFVHRGMVMLEQKGPSLNCCRMVKCSQLYTMYMYAVAYLNFKKNLEWGVQQAHTSVMARCPQTLDHFVYFSYTGPHTYKFISPES